MKHLTTGELEVRLNEIRCSFKDNGVLQLIVRRPKINEREVLETGELDTKIELTAQPPTGCKKFVEKFGSDAMEIRYFARR